MRLLGLFAGLGLFFSTPALACGGFFCNNQFPVDQSAERIVFGVDDDAGIVTMHVQIAYTGESDDFAWVVPVQENPDLFVSTDSLFAMLDSSTQPYFWLQWDGNSDCYNWYYPEAGYDYDTATNDDGESVTVVSQQTVGPYDTVVLQATSEEALLEWLQDAGYDLPDNLAPALAPYVASGQYFVGLKLTAGADTGDLRPLGLRYAGTAASIPIQLTSIAATPDMRLEVYVLGDHRAVPDNYLHVIINEAAIDWFSGGDNYEDVITLAANEAGGHAFATDYSGSASQFAGRLWAPGRYDTTTLASITDPVQWVNTLISMGFPGTSEMLDLLQEFVPVPQAALDAGITPQQFYNCMECYAEYTGSIAFDAAAATAALQSRIIAPLEEADKLFRDHAHLTRMTSSLDAVEMTIDPLFTFNDDLAQTVSNEHVATLVVDCDDSGNYETATRTIVLSDGRRIEVPSEQWFRDNDTSYLDYIDELTTPAAIIIEDLGSEGEGTVIFDYTEEAAAAARAFGGRGCGCNTAPSPLLALGGLPLIGLLALRRRRS